MKISHLKVNGVEAPLGYRFDYLTFSWRFEGQLEKTGEYRVEVSKTKTFSEILWCGTTKSSFNTISTDSNFLEPKTKYYWRVRFNKFEAVSTFETSKMNEPWEAKWISYKGETKESISFSKKFSFSKKIKQARLYTVAHGLYEVAINEVKLSEEYLTPGYHSYDLLQQYQTYDVTECLIEDTEISFVVGNGWYRGRFLFEGGFENIYGDKQKLIAELHVEYTDETLEQFYSDETWTVETNYIQENSIYDGEIIDYTTEISALTTEVIDVTTSLLAPRLDLPVEVVAEFQPRIFFDTKNQMILDFGQEITGWIFTELLEDKEYVRFQFGELLQNGAFYTENLRTAKQEFVIKNAKKGMKVRPHFTYYGFRYVKVEGLTQDEAGLVVAQALQSKMDETFEFSSSNTKLNQLISNIRWSQKDNFLSIPTDCPQRDERMGWTGDLTVFSNTACYNMETRAFFAHFMENLKLEQSLLDGATPFFAPVPKVDDAKNPFLSNAGAAVWGDAATFIPYNLYRHFRDKGLLKQYLDLMIDWVDWIYRQDEARGGNRLWDFGWQLGDWLALDSGIKGSVFGATDSALIASAYYFISADYTAKMLSVSEDNRSEFYQTLAKEVRNKIIHTYFNGDELNTNPVTLQSEVENIRQSMAQNYGGVTIPTAIDTQTGLAVLLRHGLYPNEVARDKLAKRLQEKMAEHNGYLTTGFAGTGDLPHALLDSGLREEAINLLLKKETPSWLFEVEMGATTTWERWDSILPNGEISGTDMNSLNHYAYGAVEDFIIEKLIGIQLPKVLDDTETYLIQPNFTKRLEWAKGVLQTANGELSVSWRLSGDDVLVDIVLPGRTLAKYVSSNGDEVYLKPGLNKMKDVIV
jgi:hypothetical protein